MLRALVGLVFGFTLVSHAEVIPPKTTLEFELTGVTYVSNKSVQIDVTKLNRTLKKKGLDGLPTTIVVDKNGKAYWDVLMKRIEAANKVVPTELRFTIDNGYFYEYPVICYSGEASDVPEILSALSGSFLNNEQGTLAIRFGKEKLVYTDAFKSEKALRETYGEDHPEAIHAWLKYKEKSTSVLVMSDLGPQGDGTELYSRFIRECAE